MNAGNTGYFPFLFLVTCSYGTENSRLVGTVAIMRSVNGSDCACFIYENTRHTVRQVGNVATLKEIVGSLGAV